jgi:hypothetical protein
VAGLVGWALVVFKGQNLSCGLQKIVNLGPKIDSQGKARWVRIG